MMMIKESLRFASFSQLLISDDPTRTVYFVRAVNVDCAPRPLHNTWRRPRADSRRKSRFATIQQSTVAE